MLINDLAVVDIYLFLAGTGLRVFDISDITKPYLVGRYGIAYAAICITAFYAYLTGTFDGLHVFDLRGLFGRQEEVTP